ncbi:MAG: hypothetical protein ABW095_14060 [Candidatus Thiodiazotropha sp.]
MQRSEAIVAMILSLIVAAVSVLFVSYGIAIVISEDAPIWIELFALFTIGYGVLAIGSGVWAWFGGGKKAAQIAKVASVAFFVPYVVASMDVGMISGLEVVGILGVGLLLWGNWFAVRFVAQRRAHA